MNKGPGMRNVPRLDDCATDKHCSRIPLWDFYWCIKDREDLLGFVLGFEIRECGF